MDHDAGPEVWNVPIYKAEIVIKEDPFEFDRLSVVAYVTTAESINVDKNFVGTKSEERVYYYSLYYTDSSKGGWEIINGSWEEESIDNHPDFLIKVHPEKVKTESFNSEFKIENVRKILKI